MIHTNKATYNKPISDLNKNFPAGFRSIYFRLLPDDIKFQIKSHKWRKRNLKIFAPYSTSH